MGRNDNDKDADIQGKTASCIPYARELLSEEAAALQSVAQLLDERFDAAVALILNVPPAGRVIVCGVGKTGIIGEKMSASLASVGFPSFTVHPTEAAHGDLGRITSEDLVITLSNAGSSPELIRLLPSLERLQCSLLAISANADSPLARYADVFLPLPKLKEAGPLGLAPTSSSVALLGLTDALIMSALSKRSFAGRPFAADIFAARHPGGLLGKTLLRVEEIMRRGDFVCTVTESLSCREVLHRITLTRGRPGCAGIVNERGALIGIFTDGDLRRYLDKDPHFLEKSIGSLMTRNPKVVTAGSFAADALTLMNQHQIDQVFVLDAQGIVLGLLDIQDIVQVG